MTKRGGTESVGKEGQVEVRLWKRMQNEVNKTSGKHVRRLMKGRKI